MEKASIISIATPLSIGGHKAIILLEDNTDHADSVRRVVEPLGYNLLVGSDWKTALALAENHARFFVLDIKLGVGEERAKGGLLALEALRLRYRETIFVAILTALKDQHENAIKKLGADISLQKSHDRGEDMRRILKAYEEWLTQEPASVPSKGEPATDQLTYYDSPEADLLFPSDELAVQITGAKLNDIALLLQDRREVAKALGRKPPDRDELEREIGTRMRDELRGILVELGERARDEGQSVIELTKGPRFTEELTRLIFRFLPITYNADVIMDQLRGELQVAARFDFSGEWGLVKIGDDDQVLLDLSEGGFDESDT